MPALRLRLVALSLLTLATASSQAAFPLLGRNRATPAAPATAEPLPPVNLSTEMSAADLAATGIHKLNDAERAALEAWINARQERATEAATEQYVARGEQGFGLENIPERTRVPVQTPDEIRATLPGPFRGWSGNTTLRLDNGQVWQTDNVAPFSIHVQDPEIIIRRGSFGTYFAQVRGYGTRAKVKRLQ